MWFVVTFTDRSYTELLVMNKWNTRAWMQAASKAAGIAEKEGKDILSISLKVRGEGSPDAFVKL